MTPICPMQFRPAQRDFSRCGKGGLRGWVVVALMLFSGCLFSNRTDNTPHLPSKHSVRSDQLLVLSDFRISPDHELIGDLKKLRMQVYNHLELPVQRRPVTVYLFNDETAYRNYLAEMYPGLPHRRAYFFKTSKELAVFTYWGERIQEDLRHEFTHGVLHASLKTVPLWLDEGLAEYFEVIGPRLGELNGNYASELTERIGNGWSPDLPRLESIEEFSDLERLDYQESWGWVHFMLHHTPETRETLLGYLQDLRTQGEPYPLSKRLKATSADFEQRYLVYVASLNTFGNSLQEPQTTSLVSRDEKPKVPAWAETTQAAYEFETKMPKYKLELPEHVSGRMLLSGDDGQVTFADGPTVYATAHRHGWDDFMRMFLEGNIALEETTAIQNFSQDPGTEYWDLTREARKQGILDCYRSLKQQSEQTGAQVLRLGRME